MDLRPPDVMWQMQEPFPSVELEQRQLQMLVQEDAPLAVLWRLPLPRVLRWATVRVAVPCT